MSMSKVFFDILQLELYLHFIVNEENSNAKIP